MRTRFLPLAIALALAAGVLMAAPASAAFGYSIDFPGTSDEFYSPFAGPATITFTFDGSEPDETFGVRLRPVDDPAIHTDDVFVNADDPDGTHTFTFRWPALSVSNDRTYEVVVFKDGAPVASESFQLHPPLVRIVSATPNPFLPWVDDDVKDETTIRFELAATSQPTIFKVFRANLKGRCCGALVRQDTLGTFVPGVDPEQWVWDGRGDGGGMQPKGDYFVKITAEDPSNVTATSKPFKVSIARTYRATSQLQKNGIAYHHVGPVTSYRRGGNCFVTRDETDKDLWITCLSASFTVYWRWAIPNGARVEKASFVYVNVSGEICNGKKAHTKTDSSLRVGGVGQFRCRVDLARITYSYPVES